MTKFNQLQTKDDFAKLLGFKMLNTLTIYCTTYKLIIYIPPSLFLKRMVEKELYTPWPKELKISSEKLANILWGVLPGKLGI